MNNEENENLQEELSDKESEKIVINENINPKYKTRKSSIIISVVLTFSLCLIVFGLFYNYYLKNLVIETTKTESLITVTDNGIADAVEKVYDSTVVIETYYNNQLYATGTGFVFKNDNGVGYILTNYHVIENATSVKVIFSNDNETEAAIVGGDEYSDIAVLSVNSDYIISVATIGSSEDMRVGDTTFTVGAPIDSSVYSWTVTRGILSGKNRLVEVSSSNSQSGYMVEVLQTDAAINSGNSGGPLCNANGEVIGVTNMKLASSSIEGMGFAIPIETAMEYAQKFINGESISRPYLGISMADISNNFFNTNTSGVYINYVEAGSPAANGGLQKGDLIIKINEVTVEDTAELKYQLYKYEVGDKITVTYKRDNREFTTTITLGSLAGNM